MKCDIGTICDSGYTLNPDSQFDESFVEALLNKDKKTWTKEEKKAFKQATFGSNKYTVGGLTLFVLCAFLFSQVIGATIAYLLTSLTPCFSPSFADIIGVDVAVIEGLKKIVSALIIFAFLFWGIMIFDKPFLNTDLRHLISGRKKFDWKMFFIMLISTFVLLAILSFGFAISSIEVRDLPLHIILPSALFVLIFIPMQTTAEELIFRCLLARFFYKNNLPSVKNGILLILGSGAIFMSLHLSNPEVLLSSDIVNLIFTALTYFIAGVGLMAIALVTGSFAAPLAIHFVNNLFLSIVITQEVSVLSTPTFFIDRTTANLGLLAFLQTLIMYSVLFLICYLYKRHIEKNAL